MSFKSWSTGSETPKRFSNWDDLVFEVNKEYESTDNLRAIGKELGISFNEVWEALGFVDEYNFY